jgi:hypothetical protein
VEVDGALKDDVAALRKCAGAIQQGLSSGGRFDLNGQVNLKSGAGQVALKVNDLNQNVLQPLLASALGDKKLSSASISLNVDARYDPVGESGVKGELQVVDLLLTDPLGELPKKALTAMVKLDGSLRDNRAEIRQFIGYIKQGELLGGSFDVKGDYHLTQRSGQLEVLLTDLNQNALAPLLGGALGGKKLESVSINLNGSARYDPQGESTAKGELQVSNLLVEDAGGEAPPGPLTFALQFDGSLARQVLALRKFDLMLNETPRARQQLQLAGNMDLARSNRVGGDLKLTAESLDLTPYYELFASGKKATNHVESGQFQPASAASETEPDATELRVGPLVIDAAIKHLYLREIEVADFTAAVKIETNTVAIAPFNLTLNDASVSLSATANLGVPGYEYNFNLDASRVPLGPVMESLSPGRRGQFKGLLSLNTAIKGAGVTAASLQKHLVGKANLTVTNASILLAGQDSGNKDRGSTLAALWSKVFKPISVLLQLPDLTQSPLEFVEAHAEVSSGTVKLGSLLLQSATYQATSAGTVSLADPVDDSRLNDLPVGIALERTTAAKVYLASGSSDTNHYVKLPNFVKVGGTLANPDVKTDKLALSGTLFKAGSEAFKGAAGAGAGGILGAVGSTVGGSSPASVGAGLAPAAATAAPLTNALPKAPSATDLLKLK